MERCSYTLFALTLFLALALVLPVLILFLYTSSLPVREALTQEWSQQVEVETELLALH